MAVFLEGNGHVMDAELMCEAAQLFGESLGRFRPAGRGRNLQGVWGLSKRSEEHDVGRTEGVGRMQDGGRTDPLSDLLLSKLARPNMKAWQRGQTRPTLKQLEAFAKAACVPLGYLFLREPLESTDAVSDAFHMLGISKEKTFRELGRTRKLLP